LSVVVIVHGVPFGEHSLVQDARNHNSSGVLTVKHNMLAAFNTLQAPTNVATASTQRGITGQHLAKRIESIDVADGLIFAPGPRSMVTDPYQIGFGTARKTKQSHSSTPRSLEFE
jgi:hypothetical protein